jgi:hypothetical protein
MKPTLITNLENNKQGLDATLTALADLNSTAGLVEQTGTDAFTKRLIGTTNATDILTKGGADGLYSLSAHNHNGTYQPLDATLTALAALTWSSATQIPVFTAADTVSFLTVGQAAGNILNKAAGDALYQPIGSYQPAGSYQPLDADLTAIAGLAGTTGILRKTAADTWSLDTAAYSLSSHNHDGTYQPLATTLTDLAALSYTSNAGKAIIVNGTNNGVTFTSSPLGTAAFSAASAFLASTEKGSANGLATLGADSKIPTSQLPALAITSTFVAANQTAHLAVVAQEGDVVVRTDLNKSFIHNGGSAGTMADWQELLTPTDTVTSVNGYTGAVSLTKSDIGLTNVDDTSDANKPVSTAQQTALDLKANLNAPSFTGLVKSAGKVAASSYQIGSISDSNVTLSINTGDANIAVLKGGVNMLLRIDAANSEETGLALTNSSEVTRASFKHLGTKTTLSSTGDLDVTAVNTVVLKSGTGVELQYNGTTRLATTATGITITGDLGATNLSGTNTGDETYSTITTKLSGGSGGGTTNFLRADGTFAAPPSITDGDKGDITVSASGATWTIDAGAVSLAKLANVATGTVFYRKTAATGAPEVQTLATLKTDLGLTGTNSGDQTITLTGDVTGTGTGSFAATLATVNSNTGSFGSATSVPTFTVNGKGLITAVSTNAITPAGIGAIPASEKGTANGVATLGADSKIPTSQLPALAITSTTVAANQTAHLAAVAQEGDVVVRTDLNKSYIHNGGSAGTMADWQELLTPTDAVTSVNGYTGIVSLAKSDIGLANVDNTSDANKPVSTAQQTALDLKANLTGATFSGAISATNLSGTNTGDQTITLTGPVTGSGTGSFATSITNNAVTNAMLAQVATATFKGRTTAATGNVEDLTATQATALLNTFTSTLKGLVPASGGGTTTFLRADGTWAATGVSDGDKGDITVSASGATWTIDPNAVTLGKLAQVSTATFLGRTTAATGNVEALTATQATALLDPFTTSTKGLVPAPTTSTGKFLKDDGSWDVVSQDAFTGATSGAAGTQGLVPAPSAGQEQSYLKGDGTWAAIGSVVGWSPVTAVGTGASQDITLPESGLLPQDVLVFVNGSRWNISEYTIAGTTLTLTTNASGDTIEVVKPSGAVGPEGPEGPAGPSGTGSSWGGITGTLSDQTDLQTALDTKAPKTQPVFSDSVTIGGMLPMLQLTDVGYLDFDGDDANLTITMADANLRLQSATAAVELLHAGSKKFETLSTGAQVTGAFTATGAVTGSNLSGTNTGDETYSTITSTLSAGSGGGTTNFLRADGTFAAPPGGATWGGITGTLSTQTDLQNALDAKAPTAAPSFSGTTSVQQLEAWDLTINTVSGSFNSYSDYVFDLSTAMFRWGDATLTNLVLDTTGIQALNDGATSTLNLNRLGGVTQFGGSIVATSGTFTGNITAPNFQTNYAGFCSGAPTANEVVLGAIAAVSFTMSPTTSIAKSTVAATASTVFTIKKDGSAVGTITFAAAATTGTVSITSGSITANQNITVTAPATPDSTLANISFLLRA